MFTNFPGGISSFGIPVCGAGNIGTFGMGRINGENTSKNKLVFVDSQANGDGTGRDWENAFTTVQTGVNKARYDLGTTDINYDDDRQCFVIIAPGNYAERVAFSGKNIHLFGLGLPGGDCGVTMQPATPSTFAFACGGPGLEIANLFITPSSTAVPGFYGSNFENSNLHDCVIYASGVASTGISINGTGLKGSRVYNNIVCGFTTAGLNVAADAGSYCIHGFIENNMFDVSTGGTTGVVVNNGVVCYCFRISRNYVGAGYTASIAVHAGQTGILIADNWTYAQPSGGTTRDNHYSSAGA